jgi:NADH-quinone oxidoreductase subunit N
MGYAAGSEHGIEGALKYFLLSVLTSLLMLYGLSFVFGISGSTAYAAIDLSRAGALGVVAAVLVVVGFLAKLSAAPFHFWAPDAYEGAPAVCVAFVSTVPKVAGLVALVHLFGPLSTGAGNVALVAFVAAILSMLLGNLGAYPQTDLRRLMAYSGIAHSGYLLLGVSSGPAGLTAAVFYALAYTAPSMGIMLVASAAGPKLGDFAGLVRRKPWLALVTTVFLLSLVGIPPLAGFFGKLLLFGSALAAGQVFGVVTAVVMSVVSAGYYFRVVRPMFFEQPVSAEPMTLTGPGVIAIVGCVAVTLALGVLSSPVLAALIGPAH